MYQFSMVPENVVDSNETKPRSCFDKLNTDLYVMGSSVNFPLFTFLFLWSGLSDNMCIILNFEMERGGGEIPQKGPIELQEKQKNEFQR